MKWWPEAKIPRLLRQVGEGGRAAVVLQSKNKHMKICIKCNGLGLTNDAIAMYVSQWVRGNASEETQHPKYETNVT